MQETETTLADALSWSDGHDGARVQTPARAPLEPTRAANADLKHGAAQVLSEGRADPDLVLGLRGRHHEVSTAPAAHLEYLTATLLDVARSCRRRRRDGNPLNSSACLGSVRVPQVLEGHGYAGMWMTDSGESLQLLRQAAMALGDEQAVQTCDKLARQAAIYVSPSREAELARRGFTCAEYLIGRAITCTLQVAQHPAWGAMKVKPAAWVVPWLKVAAEVIEQGVRETLDQASASTADAKS